MRTLCLMAAALLALGLNAPARAQERSGVSVKKSMGNIEFYAGNQLITKFQYGDWTRPIFYPVLSPTGFRLTRGFPMEKFAGETVDHPHQKSAWFTHGDVIAEGMPPQKRTK